MKKDEYIITVIEREIRLLDVLRNRIDNLKALDSYIKPSGTRRVGAYHELDSYITFLSNIEYLVDIDISIKSKRIYDLYNNNFNGYGRESDKTTIPSTRISVVSYLDNKITDLTTLKSDLQL